MRIGAVSPLEVRGQHAADQPDVFPGVMCWCDGAIEQTVVSNGDTFRAAAVADPNDAPWIDVADERAAGNCASLRLIDKSIGVAQRRRSGAARAGPGVVVVADDDIAVRRQMVSDVVVPTEAVSVAMTDHDDRPFAHCSDVGWKIEILTPTEGGNTERSSNTSV